MFTSEAQKYPNKENTKGNPFLDPVLPVVLPVASLSLA